LSNFNKTRNLSTYFRKIHRYYFHKNSFIGSRVLPCGQTEMTKLRVVFFSRNFANASKNEYRSGTNKQAPCTVHSTALLHQTLCVSTFVQASLINDSSTSANFDIVEANSPETTQRQLTRRVRFPTVTIIPPLSRTHSSTTDSM
jgi:hypothetical protein